MRADDFFGHHEGTAEIERGTRQVPFPHRVPFLVVLATPFRLPAGFGWHRLVLNRHFDPPTCSLPAPGAAAGRAASQRRSRAARAPRGPRTWHGDTSECRRI